MQNASDSGIVDVGVGGAYAITKTGSAQHLQRL